MSSESTAISSDRRLPWLQRGASWNNFHPWARAALARNASWRLLLFWTVPGLVATLQCTLLSPQGQSFTAGMFGRALSGSLLIWYGWAALTPLIWALGQRFPVERPRLWAHLGLHVVCVVPVVLAHTALIVFCCQWIFDDAGWNPATLASTYRNMLAGRLLLELIIYAAILVGSQLWLADQRLRRREERLTEVERELAGAQLHALRSQLQPHFLFNTLNSVAVLARAGENAAAVTMLGDLSELLRRSLTHGGLAIQNGDPLANALVSLREELEFSERYLHIECLRFGPERLQVRRSIAPDTMEARVPGFLLQPLLENAVVHGVTRRPGPGGEVHLGAWRDGEHLHLEVCDNGPGVPSDSDLPSGHLGAREAGHGVGLANVRERLQRLYQAGEHVFTSGNLADGQGFCVRLMIPFEVGEAV